MAFWILMRLWMDNSTVISVICIFVAGGVGGEGRAREKQFWPDDIRLENNQPHRLLSIPSYHFPPIYQKFPRHFFFFCF